MARITFDGPATPLDVAEGGGFALAGSVLWFPANGGDWGDWAPQLGAHAIVRFPDMPNRTLRATVDSWVNAEGTEWAARVWYERVGLEDTEFFNTCAEARRWAEAKLAEEIANSWDPYGDYPCGLPELGDNPDVAAALDELRMEFAA